MQRSSRNLKKEIIKRGDARDLERPFIDERSEEDKQIYENIRNNEYKQISTMKNKLNYYWLQLNLPELTPKSFNAYSRMKNANTATFRAIQDAARSKGREI